MAGYEMIFNEDIYHFKVTCLIDKKDKPYRVIAIEKHKNLTQFAEAILDSFKFGCNHCFGFYDNMRNWTNAKESYERFVDVDKYFAQDNAKSPNKTTIETVFSTNKIMLFLFDYGAEWHFKVKLVGKSEPEPKKKYPLILQESGKAPKEY